MAPLHQTIRPFAATLSSPAALRASSAPSVRAAFSTSSVRRGLKESDKDRDNLDSEYDGQKQEGLKEVKSGKAYWREQLASESEASVKADRGEVSSSEAAVKGLKEEAVKGGEARK